MQKISGYFFGGIWQQLTTRNWELSLPSNSRCPRKISTYRFCLYIKAITRITPEFSELSLWPDTQSSDIWSIPPKLNVLSLTQKYQTEQKDFDSKMPDRRLHVSSIQITSLNLNQVTPQPEFNLNKVTCICSIMFYYFGGDLRHK